MNARSAIAAENEFLIPLSQDSIGITPRLLDKGKSKMEEAKCVLCGHDALRKSYSCSYSNDKKRVDVAGGFCYDCPECRRYCLDNYELNWVTAFAGDEQKRKLSEYSINHQLEDKFIPLKWDDIKRILGLPSKKKA